MPSSGELSPAQVKRPEEARRLEITKGRGGQNGKKGGHQMCHKERGAALPGGYSRDIETQ